MTRLIAEWHEMTPGQQIATWGRLRSWVTWLHDRYELATEDRLPRCWPAHPGLVEELYALMVWRDEIYGAGQQSGQAARYWHSELRQVLHAAATMYAAGCRTGHRGAPRLASTDAELKRQWAQASPLAGIPDTDQQAGHERVRLSDRWVPVDVIARAVDTGYAEPFGDCIAYDRALWMPAASGWIKAAAPSDLEDVPAEQGDS